MPLHALPAASEVAVSMNPVRPASSLRPANSARSPPPGPGTSATLLFSVLVVATESGPETVLASLEIARCITLSPAPPPGWTTYATCSTPSAVRASPSSSVLWAGTSRPVIFVHLPGGPACAVAGSATSAHVARPRIVLRMGCPPVEVGCRGFNRRRPDFLRGGSSLAEQLAGHAVGRAARSAQKPAGELRPAEPVRRVVLPRRADATVHRDQL